MKKQVNYSVIEGDSPFDLEKRIRHFLEDGWVCQGGICCSVYSWEENFGQPEPDGTKYYQAVVKYED